jgi:TonB family protein
MTNRKHDIERYLRGEMTPLERHNIEKDALKDPFLADALEGAENVSAEHFLFDLHELRHSVSARTARKQPRIISMWKWSMAIAAGVILLAVSSIYFFANSPFQKAEMVASSSTHAEGETAANEDSTGDVLTDTIVNNNDHALALAKPIVDSSKKYPSKEPKPEAFKPLQHVAQQETVDRSPQRIVEADLVDPDELISEPVLESEPKPIVVERSETSSLKVIKGKVISSEDGFGLAGVNVIVKGTSIGTITDAEGNYELKLSDVDGKSLVFATIGYKEQELPASGKSELNAALETDFTQLSEVVVTGVSANGNNAPPTLKFAEPKGGREAFEQYLEQKLSYPEIALNNKIEGKVTVQFTVSQSGDLVDFKILKGLGYGCDEELIRLIKEGPTWSPTTKGDAPVTDKVKVRVKFQLPE